MLYIYMYIWVLTQKKFMFVPKLTSVWMYSSVFVHFCTGNKKESDQQISFLSHLGCIFVIPALELINVCHYVTVLFYNFSWTDFCLMWGLRRWCSIMWREIQNNLCFYTPLLTVVSPTLFCTFYNFFLRKKCEPWKLINIFYLSTLKIYWFACMATKD